MYVYKKHGTKKLSELNKSTKTFLEGFIRLDFLSMMCSYRYLEFPMFTKFEQYESGPQDENACLADIIWYFLAHGRNRDNSRKSASLGKAVYLANRNAFRYKWSASSFSIRKLLSERLAAGPFLFAEQNSSLDIPWEIDAEDFCEAVDEFIRRENERVLYFSKASWICKQLRSILTEEALGSFRFPNFPTELISVPVPIEPLTKKIEALLRDYRSADKTLNWLDN